MLDILTDIKLVVLESFFEASFSTILINCIDLILLFVLIYVFFRMLRGTEASKVIIGLFVILSLYWLSILSGFHSTEWLFSKIANYIVLVLVIIFKDDIRKLLAKIGKNNLWEHNSSNMKLDKVEELIKTLTILSKKEIGALILLEQEADLLDYVTGAIEVDALLKRELIESIFYHESPIHDGAMIIKDNKISHAGAFLPLSLSKDLPAHFGTRHRAGVGISEKTDALVLIVSEERGLVSLAHNGEINTYPDFNDLRKVLHSYMLK